MTSEYVALCREANLPRVFEAGDLITGRTLPWEAGTLFSVVQENDGVPWPERTDDYSIWLPREGDLLDLLGAEGYTKISLRPVDNRTLRGHVFAEEHNTPYSEAEDYDPRDAFNYFASGPDRCTALLRLLQAVRGVTSVGPQEPTKESLPVTSEQREAQKEMCPHCGELLDTKDGLTPYHDWPRPFRRVCPGSKQIPRNPESDARLLWNGKRNPHFTDRA